ncbi:hypothetical protein [Tropicimonas isoalkanivorans]|uniref:Sulfotransferase family protein n=1 Tax=Tropicimonas isoalkanivorans TaxID=441112 RepID=A0A1I1LJE0_9RHOB|nr:hypothetical protein [Tropicimonas isoalkanivorans]SFC73066.1 hypothetical protein SAMN04488094_108151 [Tropicimonas isoalkanivorans]
MQTGGAQANVEGDVSASLAQKTLIVHVGDHKTGSTTIQHAFAKKQVLIGGECPVYTSPLNHNYLPGLFRAVLDTPNSPDGKKAHQRLSQLAEKLAEPGPRVSVISAEQFEAFNPVRLHQLLNKYFGGSFDRIRIVAYVRPHLQRLVSSHAERIKIGAYSDDLESFFDLCMREKLFLYAPRFKQWCEVFGDDFVLRPFLRSALENGSLLDDFIVASLGQVDFTLAQSDNQNESLSLEDLLRVKYLHGKIGQKGGGFHHNYGWMLARVIGAMPNGETTTKVRIHRDLAERAGEHYLEDARELDKAMFGGAPLMEKTIQADIDSACSVPQASCAEDIFSASEIRSLLLCSQIIEEMLGNGETPWVKYFHKRRLAEMHGDG